MTSINKWDDAADAFTKFCETIAALRHPVTGCPWDLEQTHASLRRYMIEEAYEAAEVMDPADPVKLCEELGDVLLQVVLNSQLAMDQKTFNIKDVIEGIDAKMRRRHPHVFAHADEKEKHSRESGKIRAKWEEVKQSENAKKGTINPDAVFTHLKPGSVAPASQLAVAIGKAAKKISFDWANANDVFKQFESEVQELKHEVTTNADKSKIYEELGDVFFSLSQVCRHLEIDPEICASDGNRKFLRRFASLEDVARTEGIDVKTAGTEKLEELWLKAKALEKNRGTNKPR